MCLYASPICHRGTHISAGFAYVYVKHMLFKSKSNTLSNFPLENLHAKEVSLNSFAAFEAHIEFPKPGLVQSIVHKCSSSDIRVAHKNSSSASRQRILQNSLQARFTCIRSEWG